ncbi:MAG: DEAD/DEAH box helicase family protein, partial [Desulfuromonas thiophila]|nr:DEAD/DEAH box helicase family protein [Desulfuromonas thiophila]
FDHIICDEAHHLIAPTYAKIIDVCRERNPKLLLTGVTATPERGDKKSLRKFFDNVAEKITIKELVSLGFLVPPRAFVVNIGVQGELAQIRTTSAFGDQVEVARVLDTPAINGEVVRHWRDKAGGRQTIVFCATLQHAENVAQAFREAGIETGVVRGDMADCDWRHMLNQFDKGALQVLTNVAVLTEGYDSQPVACVVLLRQCSEKGPMIQMAGRGLRTVDPERYPGVVEKDCVLLDFGLSLLTHGDLDQEDGLHVEAAAGKGEAVLKTCPEGYRAGMDYKFPDRNGSRGCGALVPAATRSCPICGFCFERLAGDDLVESVDLTEIDILNASPFRWLDLFGTDTCLMACGFTAWAGVFSPDGETWHAIGKLQDERKVHKLAVTGRLQAMSAADDFLRNYETDKAAKKSRRWLDDPATEKQMDILRKFGYEVSMTKYAAACHASFSFNRRQIEAALGVGP